MSSVTVSYVQISGILNTTLDDGNNLSMGIEGTPGKVYDLDNFLVTGGTLGVLVTGGPLGTPSSGVLTNCTGLPAAGVSGLAAVATSGSYADLSSKPSLFSGAYADLTGKPSLFSGAYADLTGKPTLGSLAALSAAPAGTLTGAAVEPLKYLTDGTPQLYKLDRSAVAVDANGIFTTVKYYRVDGTLAEQSVLSGGSSPTYTTRTVNRYAADGATVVATVALTLTYDAFNNITVET